MSNECKHDTREEKRFEALGLIPPEHLPWFRVTGFHRKKEPVADDRYHMALRELSLRRRGGCPKVS